MGKSSLKDICMVWLCCAKTVDKEMGAALAQLLESIEEHCCGVRPKHPLLNRLKEIESGLEELAMERLVNNQSCCGSKPLFTGRQASPRNFDKRSRLDYWQ